MELKIKLHEDVIEYLNAMRIAVAAPGTDPVESIEAMVERIVVDNYAENIRKHAGLRPQSVTEEMKEVESAALKIIEAAIARARG